jgi:ubiquinone/menaquinone biosynthesis C-methylase UbiE
MAYDKADAKREFEDWSAGYDRDLLQHFLFKPSHRMLIDALSPADQRILDIGCGTGRFAARVLDTFPDAQVWGLDLCPGMLRGAQERVRAADGRLHVVQGDSERLPFPDNSFDAVTCSHSFHHYPNQAQVVAEMHRVLRPGGQLLIIDGDRDRPWGWLIFDVAVVWMEGAVKHLAGRAFREMYIRTGFEQVAQRRHRGLIPFLMTMGRAVKPEVAVPMRRAA